MGSLGGGVVKKKAMWLYPKVVGFNPSERWGHSACCSNGVVYVFGGCCGGLHFSDVLTLNLDTMVWSSLATTGQLPGSRDSHSAVLVGQKMIILGGTNGSRKVNDLHILDLSTNEWSRPNCEGNPPSPRESHTATVVGDDRLVIFGGSGEGEGNYLNDVHVLDLKTMKWTSPEVKGDLPAPRDSHTAVAIENKLFVYGGDCGDRYHGEVDVLDLDTLTWSRLAIQGSSPGFRAGHAAVNIGSKVYVIGGVGDKQYYNDVWVLDLLTCSWAELDICGQQPHGRFSHSAVVAESDIVIYGGCGEDERPLNELLILQLGADHPNGRYNISLCKIFGNHWNHEKRRFFRGAGNMKHMIFGNGEPNHRNHETDAERKHPILCNSDCAHRKRRRNSDPKVWEVDSEQEEHSHSLSQNSSPSQSDQEQNMVQKLSSRAHDSFIVSPHLGLFKQQNRNHHNCQLDTGSNQVEQRSNIRRTTQDFPFMSGENQRQQKTEQFIRAVHTGSREVLQCSPADQKPPQQRLPIPPLLGAEVRGTVDGAFDSGYLMTANVNGQILRGVLFSPGPGVVTRTAVIPRNLSPTCQLVVAQSSPNSNHDNPTNVRPSHPATFMLPESGHPVRQAQQPQVIRSTPSTAKQPARLNSELQGVVLTLGGPGSCQNGT
ncbi:rab9 effector protein with kelch motifs-like protein isoform X1 [Cinnamomum micranthum f. kanehirae]|uniref:Rab9 effector protein with kelch motifs-like protein isoform X1 n=1 Tax=Cinnamomum micranthum f. kanehirae TaxID=337451 RepID=A0A3S3P666_9MAGN|nr:rab9 effector protein with kelch motifs-like protein isoform X1 [Cinnamomum micranthum f. kanehirae]